MEHKTTRAHTELPHTRGGRPFASVPGACALRVRPGGAGQAGRGPRPASGAEGRSVGPTLSLRHGRRRKAMLCRLPWEPRGAGPPLRPPSRRRAQHVRRGHPEARRASSSLGGTREQRFESRDRFAAPRAVAEASGVGALRLRPRGGVGKCPRAPASPPLAPALAVPSGRPSSCGGRVRRGFWRQTLSTSQEPWFKSFGNKQLVKNLKGKSRTFGQQCVPARGDPHISSTRLHPSLSPQDPETSTSPMVSIFRVHAFP